MKVPFPSCIIQKMLRFKVNPQRCVYASWSVICIDFPSKAAQPLSLLHAEHVVLNPLGSWVLDIIVLIQNSSGGWEGRCCAPLCFLMNVNRGRLADFQQQLRRRKSIQRGQIGLINCVLNIWRRCDGRKLPLHERLWLPKWLILTIRAQTHSLKTSIYSYLQSW